MAIATFVRVCRVSLQARSRRDGQTEIRGQVFAGLSDADRLRRFDIVDRFTCTADAALLKCLRLEKHYQIAAFHDGRSVSQSTCECPYGKTALRDASAASPSPSWRPCLDECPIASLSYVVKAEHCLSLGSPSRGRNALPNETRSTRETSSSVPARAHLAAAAKLHSTTSDDPDSNSYSTVAQQQQAWARRNKARIRA